MFDTPATLDAAIGQAQQLAAYAKKQGVPCAWEVVKTTRGLVVQVFGTHALFKTHKLLHVEPIPQ